MNDPYLDDLEIRCEDAADAGRGVRVTAAEVPTVLAALRHYRAQMEMLRERQRLGDMAGIRHRFSA